MSKLVIKSSFTFPSHEEDEKTLPELLLIMDQRQAENGQTLRILDVLTKESYDFGSLQRLTRNVASALHKRGLRKGDVVLYLTYDLVKLQIFQVGVWRANGIVRASYPEDDQATILYRVEECRIGWIYCEPEAAEMCLAVAKSVYWDVEVILTSRDAGPHCISIYELMEDDGEDLPQFDCLPKSPAAILSTSGTTGMSKGAVLSHTALMWAIKTFMIFPVDDQHLNLLVSKGTHVTGFMIPLMAILKGAPFLVMHSIRNREDIFQAIQTYRPKSIFAFPTLLVSFVNDPAAAAYDFSSLEVFISGGAPVTSAIENIIFKLPSTRVVLSVYGLTEVAPVVSTINIDDIVLGEGSLKLPDLPLNSMGKLCAGVSARFQDLETGKAVGPNETGELCLKCNGMFTEYINNPEATKKSFYDGFFKTGDVGFYDENGFIYLIDRQKEIFKYLGNHVSPTEIETIINDHPAVGEVCVVGVEDIDGGGHVPRAFCVILNGFECLPIEIEEYANSRLANFKHVRGGVYFVHELPKGKTGKVVRQLVEKLPV